VLIDGVRTNSCLKLAVTLDGREITTVEGLGQPSNLHPHQTASVEHDPFQCGYCSPGQICSARVMNIASIGGGWRRLCLSVLRKNRRLRGPQAVQKPDQEMTSPGPLSGKPTS
jgi:xanthine dehydrogenase iron-sulfur cluster and FAD-binding subunit A